MSKLQILKTESGGNVLSQKFPKQLVKSVIKEDFLFLIFKDKSKKKIKLSSKQKEILSNNGKIYEHDNSNKIVSIISIKLM